MPFGGIVAKLQVNGSAGGGGSQSFFEQEVMKNYGHEHFYFCLKWLKFVGRGVQFGVRKTVAGHKSLIWIWYQQTRFPGVNVGIGD